MAAGTWGLSPSEFWRMTPRAFWLWTRGRSEWELAQNKQANRRAEIVAASLSGSGVSDPAADSYDDEGADPG